jgi:hypothetical protein
MTFSATAARPDDTVRFRPSRVEGVDDVSEVCVSPDILELATPYKRIRLSFRAMALGREIASGRAPVGESHFSNDSYPDSRFVFYTTPPIAIYMPLDGPTAYPHSHFWRVQEMLRRGGFKVYDDGPPKWRPTVLNPRPARTVAYVLAILAFSWALVSTGFLPDPLGGAFRRWLLSNPRNTNIGLGFILPALAIPAVVALRHGRTVGALLQTVAACLALALVSDWVMFHAVRAWATPELRILAPPFWTAHRVGTALAPVVVSALVGWSWRRGCLEAMDARDEGLQTPGSL